MDITRNLTRSKTERLGVLNKYVKYAKAQENRKVYWYSMTLIVFPLILMVPTIFLMRYATDNFVWFISFTMVIFYANMMAHIGESKSTFFVPLFHLSVLLIIGIPLVTLLLN